MVIQYADTVFGKPEKKQKLLENIICNKLFE
jgi:hypothetical protein